MFVSTNISLWYLQYLNINVFTQARLCSKHTPPKLVHVWWTLASVFILLTRMETLMCECIRHTLSALKYKTNFHLQELTQNTCFGNPVSSSLILSSVCTSLLLQQYTNNTPQWKTKRYTEYTLVLPRYQESMCKHSSSMVLSTQDSQKCSSVVHCIKKTPTKKRVPDN